MGNTRQMHGKRNHTGPWRPLLHPVSTLCPISLTNVGWLFPQLPSWMVWTVGWPDGFRDSRHWAWYWIKEVDALFVLLTAIFAHGRQVLAGPWIMAAGWIRPVVQLMRTYWPSSKTRTIRTYPWAHGCWQGGLHPVSGGYPARSLDRPSADLHRLVWSSSPSR